MPNKGICYGRYPATRVRCTFTLAMFADLSMVSPRADEGQGTRLTSSVLSPFALSFQLEASQEVVKTVRKRSMAIYAQTSFSGS